MLKTRNHLLLSTLALFSFTPALGKPVSVSGNDIDLSLMNLNSISRVSRTTQIFSESLTPAEQKLIIQMSNDQLSKLKSTTKHAEYARTHKIEFRFGNTKQLDDHPIAVASPEGYILFDSASINKAYRFKRDHEQTKTQALQELAWEYTPVLAHEVRHLITIQQARSVGIKNLPGCSESEAISYSDERLCFNEMMQGPARALLLKPSNDIFRSVCASSRKISSLTVKGLVNALSDGTVVSFTTMSQDRMRDMTARTLRVMNSELESIKAFIKNHSSDEESLKLQKSYEEVIEEIRKFSEIIDDPMQVEAIKKFFQSAIEDQSRSYAADILADTSVKGLDEELDRLQQKPLHDAHYSFKQKLYSLKQVGDSDAENHILVYMRDVAQEYKKISPQIQNRYAKELHEVSLRAIPKIIRYMNENKEKMKNYYMVDFVLALEFAYERTGQNPTKSMKDTYQSAVTVMKNEVEKNLVIIEEHRKEDPSLAERFSKQVKEYFHTLNTWIEKGRIIKPKFLDLLEKKYRTLIKESPSS